MTTSQYMQIFTTCLSLCVWYIYVLSVMNDGYALVFNFFLIDISLFTILPVPNFLLYKNRNIIRTAC